VIGLSGDRCGIDRSDTEDRSSWLPMDPITSTGAVVLTFVDMVSCWQEILTARVLRVQKSRGSRESTTMSLYPQHLPLTLGCEIKAPFHHLHSVVEPVVVIPALYQSAQYYSSTRYHPPCPTACSNRQISDQCQLE
jgi:hypothetical protein